MLGSSQGSCCGALLGFRSLQPPFSSRVGCVRLTEEEQALSLQWVDRNRAWRGGGHPYYKGWDNALVLGLCWLQKPGMGRGS